MKWTGKITTEVEVKIALIPRDWTSEDEDMFRVSCGELKNGWGKTLKEAIKDFDKRNIGAKLNGTL